VSNGGFHEVTFSKPSCDRRWRGAVSVIERIIVISFLCPTAELWELTSVQILNCKYTICDRKLSQFMKMINKDFILLA
jgi:hypothetical protein